MKKTLCLIVFTLLFVLDSVGWVRFIRLHQAANACKGNCPWDQQCLERCAKRGFCPHAQD